MMLIDKERQRMKKELPKVYEPVSYTHLEQDAPAVCGNPGGYSGDCHAGFADYTLSIYAVK